jgi:hypothetical protein
MSDAEQALFSALTQVISPVRATQSRRYPSLTINTNRRSKGTLKMAASPQQALIAAFTQLIDERLLMLVGEKAAAKLRDRVLTDMQTPGIPASEMLSTLPEGSELLDVNEFAARLTVSDQTVRNREGQGEFFSVLAPARRRGREFPAFQLLSGVQGEPLKRTLAELKALGGAEKYQFFTTTNELLASLSPVRVLVGGAVPVGASSRAATLLKQTPALRLDAVINAAKTFAAELDTG